MRCSSKVRVSSRRAALAVCLLLAAAVGGRPALAGDPELSVSNAWMRFIMSSVPAAGYFRLSNAGARPRVLVGADSPACGMIMFHESILQNGMERMLTLMSIQVPPHGHVDFTPGHYHLMCMQPSPEMIPGHQVTVTLRFADGEKVAAPFSVRGAAAARSTSDSERFLASR